jgi:hypothetical protein
MVIPVAHKAGFENARSCRALPHCAQDSGRPWETPTKIFSQISPKRSPGTHQGRSPVTGDRP